METIKKTDIYILSPNPMGMPHTVAHYWKFPEKIRDAWLILSLAKK